MPKVVTVQTAIERIREKQTLYEQLAESLATFETLLSQLPIEDTEAVKEWIEGIANKRRRDEKAAKNAELGPDVLMPSDAILTLLRESPNLLTRQIIDQLQGKIKTTSGKPERIIYTTLFNLKQAGKIVQDKATERYRLPD